MNNVKQAIQLLKDVDGETLEHVIRELAMEDQMLRQLIMNAPVKMVEWLLEEKKMLPKVFRCVMQRDEKGLGEVDVTEIYNVTDQEERYPTAHRQWRIGEVINGNDVFIDENGIAYSKKLSCF